MSEKNNELPNSVEGKEYKNKNIKAKLLSSQRITTLDLARILAMITMIMGHSLDAIATPAELDISQFPWNIWHYIRRFTAPIFLTVSGAVHVFANKRDENGRLQRKTIIRRVKIAVILSVIGYLFMFPAYSFFDAFFIEAKLWRPFFQVNILQLIGFSLLFVLLLFLITKKDKTLGIVSFSLAVIITISSPFIHSINWFNYLPEFFAAYLSTEHGSMFPVFPYTGFMLYGVAFGIILKIMDPEKRTKFLIWAGVPIGLVFLIPSFFLTDFFKYEMAFKVLDKVNPGIILNQIGVVFIVLAFAGVTYTYTKKISFYYAFFGKNALFIYVAHLIFLFGSGWFPSIARLYPKQIHILPSILISIIIVLLTLGTAYFYEFTINKFPNARKYYKYAFYIILVYFLIIGTLAQLIYQELFAG
ncbi:MAG: hypothetical protein A2X61_11160 [Ignavibacteria bacterium GWB2_35_12]|nr:MAG: hypothetical protein A2X61_11160 [Ignavibacteria bacterium GWB2_35_12]OGU86623.1 MAG: hypothetical protein A2220_02515 [Ignavibacteria bacterium RIFOXYA2_FULL_35_10]OGV23995.1 MAG: hypothetical protein A2475_10805 [Ignavibacteria bacterium RIFOXYC2_FULL_35_21]